MNENKRLLSHSDDEEGNDDGSPCGCMTMISNEQEKGFCTAESWLIAFFVDTWGHLDAYFDCKDGPCGSHRGMIIIMAMTTMKSVAERGRVNERVEETSRRTLLLLYGHYYYYCYCDAEPISFPYLGTFLLDTKMSEI